MLPVVQWYAALMGPPRIATAPNAAGRGRATLSRRLGHGLIRLGRALSRRDPRGAGRLVHGTVAR